MEKIKLLRISEINFFEYINCVDNELQSKTIDSVDCELLESVTANTSAPFKFYDFFRLSGERDALRNSDSNEQGASGDVNSDEQGVNGVSTELNLYTDPWIIKKKVTETDLNGCSRLLIPTNLVKNKILPFINKENRKKIDCGEGMKVNFWDVNICTNHEVVFKRWSSSKSYVFIDGWYTDFVTRRKLRKGDEIGLAWGYNYKGFFFNVLSRAQSD
ncbi:putative B3 domain-containing protein At1g78640 [Mercurialis annua]|uniref:putative B3 domain-containing protein At1g78640 n=1 Tax=Mercurialis annua TaxID=3986 RepID=UPI0024AF4876|nr:putative B3 domain-containing protein At1g78640 [Mercurialis annua]